jgi:hypothetical protein
MVLTPRIKIKKKERREAAGEWTKAGAVTFLLWVGGGRYAVAWQAGR